MEYYVVQIGNQLIKVYSERELEALEEVKNIYYIGNVTDCVKALRGLYILMKNRVPPSIVSVIDKAVAEAIKRGECSTYY